MEKHTKKRLTKKSLLFVFDKPNKKTHAQLYAKNKQKKSILSKKDLLCLGPRKSSQGKAQMLKRVYFNQQIQPNQIPTQTPRSQTQSKQSKQHIESHSTKQQKTQKGILQSPLLSKVKFIALWVHLLWRRFRLSSVSVSPSHRNTANLRSGLCPSSSLAPSLDLSLSCGRVHIVDNHRRI